MKHEKLHSKAKSRILAVVLCVVFAPTLFASSAKADTPQPTLAIHQLDATEQDELSAYFIWTGESTKALNASVSINEQPVDASIRREQPSPSSIGVLVDVSKNADQTGVLDASKSWLTKWLQSRPEEERVSQQVALYAVGAEPVQVFDYTTSLEVQLDGVRKLNSEVGTTLQDPENETPATWSAFTEATTRLEGLTVRQENLLYVGTGQNSSSEDFGNAKAGIESTGAIVYSAIAPAGSSRALDSLSGLSGGVSLSTEEKNDLGDKLDEIAVTLEQAQYVAVVQLEGNPPNVITATITIDGKEVAGVVTNGSVAKSVSSLPIAAPSTPTSSIYLHPVFLIFGLVLFAGAAALVTYVLLGSTLNKRTFSEQVAFYTQYGDGKSAPSLTEEEKKNATKSILIKRAIDATEKIAEQRNLLARVEIALERADVSLKPAEFLFLYFALIPMAALVGLYVNGPLFFILFGFIFAVGPPALLSHLAERRRKKFSAQLPDMLHLVAGSLRAGYSLPQGIEAASEEAGEPIAQELRRAINETRLGADPIEALDRVALRMNSRDFSWAVMGIAIQKEVGGDLAELLDTIANTMTQRERLRREIMTLTAEGRISALILVLLPVALAVIIYLLNPEYMAILFTSAIGNILLLLGGLGLVVGWIIMKKIVSIKV